MGVNSKTREFFYRRYYTHFDEQEENIQQLIGARHELAKLTGFDSFADRSQTSSVLRNYEDAKKFLNGLIDTFSDSMEPELGLVRHTLRKEIPKDSKLCEWDFAYGSAIFRQKCFGFTESLSKYFHFETILSGFEMLVNKLYGIKFDVSVPIKGEVWDGNVIKIVSIEYRKIK